jgi:hypothetical protein
MKFSDVALTVLIVLVMVILVFLLSSTNPKEGVVAPLVVPVRTFFGYLGGRGKSTTINIVGSGSSSSSSSSSSSGPPEPPAPPVPPVPPVPEADPFSNYAPY